MSEQEKCEVIDPSLKDIWNLLRELERKVELHLKEEEKLK